MEPDGHCPVSQSPYHHCPFVFEHESGDVLNYLTSFAIELKRVNNLKMDIDKESESVALDKFACIISAYINGRVKQAIEILQK